jgi:glutaredoxin-like YruB-family protein
MKNEKNIVVYSTPDCAYCYTVKSYLHSKGMEFKEINIYEDEEERKEMEEISGQKSVPVTVIDGTAVTGWDKEKIHTLLNA